MSEDSLTSRQGVFIFVDYIEKLVKGMGSIDKAEEAKAHVDDDPDG